MPVPENVATPFTAVALLLPTIVDPLFDEMVTTAELLATVLPNASRMAITGCTSNGRLLTAPEAGVVIANCVAVPKVGVIFCVAEVRLAEANVSVYCVPAVPLMPTLVKVATPFTAFTVVVPTVVPLPLTVMVTIVELSETTVFPPLSRMATTGWVVKADPLALPAAWVVTPNCVAVPTVGVIFCVAEVRLVEANVNVYCVPAVPLMPTLVKVATPFTAFNVVVPTVVPLPLTVMVTAAVLLVTVLPKASWMVTTGWVVNAEPLALPAAWVVMANCEAEPKVGVIFCVAEVRLVEAKVSVYCVPAVPLMPTLVKVATPFTAFTVVVPTVVPFPLTVIVTAAVLVVTVLPKAS